MKISQRYYSKTSNDIWCNHPSKGEHQHISENRIKTTFLFIYIFGYIKGSRGLVASHETHPLSLKLSKEICVTTLKERYPSRI
jgi:hypothetical protein